MEIVDRALFVCVFLWLITRVVGRSTLGGLSMFQLILFITVGDMMRSVTHGVAVVVVNRGEPVPDVMKAERLSLDDLIAAARAQGYERFSQISLTVLEANGQMPFFGTKGEGAPPRPSIG